MSSDKQLDGLFPSISPASSPLAPSRWPGNDAQSAEAATTVLKENHVKFHTFFDPRGLHNHISHYVLALYALGAHKESIESGYAHEAAYQAASSPPPEAITAQNFKDHLGDDKYYEGYRKYYADLVLERGVKAALQEALEVQENFDPNDSSNKQKEMLNRLLDGLLHPMIHAGYGVEFGLPGLVVEGLASAAVHKAEGSAFIPAELWEDAAPSKEEVHALSVLARIINDPQFDNGFVPGPPNYTKTGVDYGKAIYNYVKGWSFDASNPGELEKKVEEIIWANAIIYGVGGWTKESFEANFFVMHFVTSSLFIHTLATQLTPKSAEIFLRAYFATVLGWWVNRGRKPLDIEGFYSADTAYPVPGHTSTVPVRPNAVPSAKSHIAATPNPWFPLIHTALTLPDDHLIKLYRALAHFGSIYGNRKPGYFAGTELKGAEKLDGTLFLRIAGVTEKRINESPRINAPMAFIWDGVPAPAEFETQASA